MNLNQLYDFQIDCLDKLKDAEGALIGDDMGLGKTYEGLALDAYHRGWDHLWSTRKLTLVVAPQTVLPSWKQHVQELTDLNVHVIDPKARKKSWEGFVADKGDILLVHWEALRLMPELREVYWFHIIADECHRMKNRKAQQTRALKALKSKFKTGMSGTLVINQPDELWSPLNWLYPNDFKAYWRFFERYTEYEIRYPAGYRIVTGPKNVVELQKKIEPFFVRRLKKDVLKDLPDKYYSPLWVDLSGPQRKAYNTMRKEMIAWVGEHESTPLVAPVVIAQLVRLQQFSAGYMEWNDELEKFTLSEPSSKLDALMQILEDNPNEQVVVFSQFKQLVKLAERRLQTAGIPFATITGDTSQTERGRAVERFQGGEARVFVGTISAGGVGITLHAASTVVFLDRGWSPATNAQAEDRLHRIGQKNAVNVVDIMAINTVDLGRKQKLEMKWSWIRQLLGGE
jgi:SNF2 family DNA or RNA helicase